MESTPNSGPGVDQDYRSYVIVWVLIMLLIYAVFGVLFLLRQPW